MRDDHGKIGLRALSSTAATLRRPHYYIAEENVLQWLRSTDFPVEAVEWRPLEKKEKAKPKTKAKEKVKKKKKKKLVFSDSESGGE